MVRLRRLLCGIACGRLAMEAQRTHHIRKVMMRAEGLVVMRRRIRGQARWRRKCAVMVVLLVLMR